MAERLGIDVSPDGLLVFTWPGSNSPAIRPNEDLTYQSIRAERGDGLGRAGA